MTSFLGTAYPAKETSDSLVAKINALADHYRLRIPSLEGIDMPRKTADTSWYNSSGKHYRTAALVGYRVCYQKPYTYRMTALLP